MFRELADGGIVEACGVIHTTAECWACECRYGCHKQHRDGGGLHLD